MVAEPLRRKKMKKIKKCWNKTVSVQRLQQCSTAMQCDAIWAKEAGYVIPSHSSGTCMYYERSCLPPLPWSLFFKKKKIEIEKLLLYVYSLGSGQCCHRSAHGVVPYVVCSILMPRPPHPTRPCCLLGFGNPCWNILIQPATILYVYVCVTVTKTTTARPWLCVHSSDSLELKHATTNNLSAPSCSEHALLEIYSYDSFWSLLNRCASCAIHWKKNLACSNSRTKQPSF